MHIIGQADPRTKSGTAPAPTDTAPNPPASNHASKRTAAKGRRVAEIRNLETADVEVLPPALTDQQAKELQNLEAVISKNLKTFLETGRALAAIRDKKLYHPHLTFEEYVEDKWGFTRQRAYQYIQSADMVTVLQTRVDTTLLPTSERAAREVLKARDENRVRVLELAHEKANGNPTTEDIARARSEIEPPKPKPRASKKKTSIKVEAALKAAEKLSEFLSQDSPPALDEHQKVELMVNLNSILGKAQQKQLLEPTSL